MYASIDGVVKKLEKQIHKHRTALGKLREGAFSGSEYDYAAELADEKMPKIVRTKKL